MYISIYTVRAFALSANDWNHHQTIVLTAHENFNEKENENQYSSYPCIKFAFNANEVNSYEIIMHLLMVECVNLGVRVFQV